MPIFSVGNRVKMLKDTMQGVVQKVDSNGIVTIETDEGFEIPVMANELVLIPNSEKSVVLPQKTKMSKRVHQKSLFFCASLDSKSKAQLYIVNNEWSEKLIVLSKKDKEEYRNYVSIKLEGKAHYKIPGIYAMNEVETWNKWLIQVLPFSSQEKVGLPFEVSIQIKSKKLFLAEESLPLLDNKGLYYLLEPSIKEKQSKPETSQIDRIDTSGLALIDIHAEALSLDDSIDNLQNLQFEAFLKHFENCVAFEVPSFTVIHGTGKGILKNRVHKFLSKNEHVKSFKESRKDQFGYGATDISLA